MKKLAALVLGLVLAGPAVALPQLGHPYSIPTNTAEQLEEIHRTVWRHACALMASQCKFPAPVVAYALMDAYGRYKIGSNVVLVDLRMYGQEFGALVILHEMIHYIQAMERPTVVEIDSSMFCKDEEEAHRLVYAFSLLNKVAVGDVRLKDWTPERAMGYGCLNVSTR